MSELIDLVNAQGEVVRREIPRNDADTYDGLHMQIVIMVIFNSLGEVLIHKRAEQKKVNGGYIDHVCGAIKSGEGRIEAGIREAEEEVGVTPQNVREIMSGVNSYNRYRTLLVGESNDVPFSAPNANEVEWVRVFSVEALKANVQSDELKLVDGFMDDLDTAMSLDLERILNLH